MMGPRIDSPWPGAEVLVVETTDSTMDDCLELGLRGRPTGTTVVAGFQTRGRGRTPTRRWLSPPWQSLLATVLVRRPDFEGPPSQLPLRAGLAVSRAIEEAAGARPAIRWPNDATLEGRKVAGVLCEARADLLLVGIGINCLQRSFPEEIADSACSILSVTGIEVPPLQLCPALLDWLREALAERSWREAIEERLDRKGQSVRVRPIGAVERASEAAGLRESGSAKEGGGEGKGEARGEGAAEGESEGREGIVLGIDEDGSLLLRDPRGQIIRAAQGEISGNP